MGLPLARISLALTALVYGALGGAFVVRPELLEVTGVVLPTGAAKTEIRSIYGGLELGLGVFFAIACARPAWFRAGLVAQIASFSGIALARVIGLGIDREPEPLTFVLLGAEIVGALFGLVALRRERSRS